MDLSISSPKKLLIRPFLHSTNSLWMEEKLMSNLLNPQTPQEHLDPPLLTEEAAEEPEFPVVVVVVVVVMELPVVGEVEEVHEAVEVTWSHLESEIKNSLNNHSLCHQSPIRS